MSVRELGSRRSLRWGAGAMALLVLVFVLAACTASQPAAPGPGQDVPGFWLGLWQGFIAPITFIVSLFVEGVRMYAFPNAGRWYDFGFILGLGLASGGFYRGARGRRRR